MTSFEVTESAATLRKVKGGRGRPPHTKVVLQVGIHARGTWMFTGTLIDELISTVERAETSFRLDPEQESKLEYWYAVAQNELASQGTYELAGVA